MTETKRPVPQLLLWVCELLFSIYSALLIVSVNGQTKGFSWAIKLRLFYISHRYPHAVRSIDDNYGVSLTAFLLVWVSAMAIFLCLLLLKRSPSTQRVLVPLTGVVAVAGFPAAALYTAHGGLLFIKLEAAISIVFVVLCIYRAWPASAALNVILLVLHFGFWSWGFQHSHWPGLILFWPGWDWVWRAGQWSSLVYPLIGFSSSIAWGLYVKGLRCASPTPRAG